MGYSPTWGIWYPDEGTKLAITNWTNLATSVEEALNNVSAANSGSSGYDISVCLAEVDSTVDKVSYNNITAPLVIKTNMPDSKGNLHFSKYLTSGVKIEPNTACIILGGLNFWSVPGDNNHFNAAIYMNYTDSSTRNTVSSINTFTGGYSNKTDNQSTLTFPPGLLPASSKGMGINVSVGISNTQGCNISTSGSKFLFIGLSKGA